MLLVMLCTAPVFLVGMLQEKADAHDLGIIDVGMDYFLNSVQNAPKDFFTSPMNNHNSINYALYTPTNPKSPCYIEPTPEGFEYCSFNSTLKTIFLIHGLVEILKPGNLFEKLKDRILDYGDFNIVIVDWSPYHNFPLLLAIRNSQKVGKKVAETVKFIISHTGADPRQFHCIGHSLGAHTCGTAARRVPHFHRVTGLDPAGHLVINRLLGTDVLTYKDAYYVDFIHTSYIATGVGLGTVEPLGDNDFYVNGGIYQKQCKFGKEYTVFKGEVIKVETMVDIILCNHFIAIVYFINSVQEDKQFTVTKCESFFSALLNPVIKVCTSNSSVSTKFGFHSEKIPGKRSVFYVETP